MSNPQQGGLPTGDDVEFDDNDDGDDGDVIAIVCPALVLNRVVFLQVMTMMLSLMTMTMVMWLQSNMSCPRTQHSGLSPGDKNDLEGIFFWNNELIGDDFDWGLVEP